MRCEQVAEILPDVVEGTGGASSSVFAHVESCLRCQAELAQYRKVLRALHQLRTEVLEPAPGLLPDIFAALEAVGERRAMRHLLTGRRAAYVGGIAAAATAGAAGAIVLDPRVRRQRHLRPAA